MSIEKNMFKKYLDSKKKGSTEEFRSEFGIDWEIDDKKLKKIRKNFDIKLENEKKKYFLKKKHFLKNKFDVNELIKNSNEGLDVDCLLSGYNKIQKDLLEIVKFSGKQRKLIILKGKYTFQLNIFPFQNIYWIFVSKKTIQFWHSIKI
jgi:hypothetical protein